MFGLDHGVFRGDEEVVVGYQFVGLGNETVAAGIDERVIAVEKGTFGSGGERAVVDDVIGDEVSGVEGMLDTLDG